MYPIVKHHKNCSFVWFVNKYPLFHACNCGLSPNFMGRLNMHMCMLDLFGGGHRVLLAWFWSRLPMHGKGTWTRGRGVALGRDRMGFKGHMRACKSSSCHRLSMTPTGWLRRQVVGELWGKHVSWERVCGRHTHVCIIQSGTMCFTGHMRSCEASTHHIYPRR